MTDLSEVRSLAANLRLSESTVDTAAATDALASLKQATVSIDDTDAATQKWLSDEHFAGGVLLTAATMNKRAEISGKGDPFNRQSRDVLISRFNHWASQFHSRLEQVESGVATAASFLPALARFREDPVHREP